MIGELRSAAYCCATAGMIADPIATIAANTLLLMLTLKSTTLARGSVSLVVDD